MSTARSSSMRCTGSSRHCTSRDASLPQRCPNTSQGIPVAAFPRIRWNRSRPWSGSGPAHGSTATTTPGSANRKKTRHGSISCRRGRICSDRGFPGPIRGGDAPREGTRAWYAYMAWEEMYAAEGSDWFWWYGADQTAPAGDTPFDLGYLAHLKNVYRFARLAGGRMPVTDLHAHHPRWGIERAGARLRRHGSDGEEQGK